jgi:hypothetical protein
MWLLKTLAFTTPLTSTKIVGTPLNPAFATKPQQDNASTNININQEISHPRSMEEMQLIGLDLMYAVGGSFSGMSLRSVAAAGGLFVDQIE